MPELSGPPAELRFTLQITRKDTGKVEEVEMVGFTDPADLDAFVAAKNTEPKEQ